jgi:hypothetical protein
VSLQTLWHLRWYPGAPNRIDVIVSVDTTAPEVIKAIEQAADKTGIELERIRVEEEPE